MKRWRQRESSGQKERNGLENTNKVKNQKLPISSFALLTSQQATG